MQATVYLLRDRGIKLPRPTPPVVGQLLLTEELRGDERLLCAYVLQGKLNLARPLVPARVTRVTGNGMVIKGVELHARTESSKSKVSKHLQTWWVLVHTDVALQTYQSGDPLDDHEQDNQLAELGAGPAMLPPDAAAPPDPRPAWQWRNNAPR